MDFTLNEEQQLLKDSVDRFVRENYELSQRRELVAKPEGFSRDQWATMAELGWLGAALPEAYGGIGGGAVETMIIMEGFGSRLVVEPYFSSVVLGGNLLLKGGSEEQRNTILPALIAGETMLTFGYAERQSRFDLHDVETKATKKGGGYRIDGHKGVVLHGGTADKIIVSARTAGGGRDRDGITLFLVDRAADGVAIREYQTIDGLRAAEVELRDVAVGADAVVGDPDQGLPLIEDVARRAIAALSAEAVGVIDTMKTLTNEYLQTREQFGRPIGKFQALQHRAADMYAELELSRSTMILAAIQADNENDDERRADISAAKHQLAVGGWFVQSSAIQLFGGIGVTDEQDEGLFFKRLRALNALFGDADHHVERYQSLARFSALE